MQKSTKMENMKTTLPAEIRPEQITAVIDTREQMPLDLAPLRVEIATLTTGDYSVKGLEHVIAIERKSLSDALSCIGQQRERFDKEIQRMLAYPTRAVVVETTWADLSAASGGHRSHPRPRSVRYSAGLPRASPSSWPATMPEPVDTSGDCFSRQPGAVGENAGGCLPRPSSPTKPSRPKCRKPPPIPRNRDGPS